MHGGDITFRRVVVFRVKQELVHRFSSSIGHCCKSTWNIHDFTLCSATKHIQELPLQNRASIPKIVREKVGLNRGYKMVVCR